MTLDAAVTQPLIIKIAGVVQLDMYHISGLQKKSHLLFTGDAFCKILAHGLGDRLLITSMTSIIASSVSGGKAGGLHLGIGGRDLFVVAIFYGKYVRCSYRLFDLFFKLLHTDKIRREDDLGMPGRNTYVVEEGIMGPHIYNVTIL